MLRQLYTRSLLPELLGWTLELSTKLREAPQHTVPGEGLHLGPSSKRLTHTFNKKAIFYGHCETSRSFVDSSTGQLDTGLTHAEDEAAAGRAPRHEPLLVVHLAEEEAAVLLEHLPQDNPPSEGDLTCRCSPWCPSA